MKNRYMLSLLLVISTVVYAMENNLPNYSEYHQRLRGMYKNCVITAVKKYAESGTIDMDALIKVGNMVTKAQDVTAQLLHPDIKDEHDNRLIHFATQKKDLALVSWLITEHHDKNYVYVNKDQKYPLDICIEQLQPNVIDSNSNSRQIFDLMLSDIAQLPSDHDDFKKICLEKIFTLKLNHKRGKKDFVIEEELLQSLAGGTLEQKSSILALIYQKTVDGTDGNTLTHMLVEQENPDELYELAKAGQLSWLPNKKGLTASDIALKKSLEAIENIALVGSGAESLDQRQCCLFILMHYLRDLDRKKGVAVTPLGNCCSKHVFQ